MITLSNGRVQGPNNVLVPNGSIKLSLQSDSQVIASPFGQVVSNIPVSFQFDNNGNLPANAQIWSNAELTPAGSTYLVNFFDINGARINQTPIVWRFTQANGATVDIGTLAPVQPTIQNINMSRLILNGGTPLLASNFALSGGWGATATVTGVVGYDSAWQITVTPNGAGIVTNPTVTLTFADGTWANAPIVMSKSIGGTGGLAMTTDSSTTTTWTFTFVGLPVAASTYIFQGIALGR